MFDQILDLVKEHLGSKPEVANLPADQKAEVEKEVASHIDTGIKQQASSGGIGGLLSSLTSGGAIPSAIEGGLIGNLGSRFGLSPTVTAAIAGALPGILQKFAHKANDPNDNSITMESITKSIGGGNLGGLGSMFGFGK